MNSYIVRNTAKIFHNCRPLDKFEVARGGTNLTLYTHLAQVC